ncbi:MAG: non-hydrolyzing UDP-N-acetylglucosamine 2-epimerase [Vibrio ordalii]|uniref:non-hydrolyzing UDP-N-acetylglucosamine 2-epimerase n=1 Tax=Vibrio TaxID=662 RepID=UPI003D2FD1CC
MKIVTILGARPQFIKAGSVSREIAQQKIDGVNIDEVIVHTGQHYDENMSDIFFDEMKIPKPKYFLGVSGKTHGAMTGQMIEKIEEVLIAERPDWVLVYGDTNSTLSGAIAASKLHIKIAHVEAGLRSFNSKMPEEINRIVTDRLSSILFCPTQAALNNLKNEGVSEWMNCRNVLLVGDVMKDGANFYRNLALKPSNLSVKSNYVLCTIHRAENTDNLERLNNIISALREIALEKQVILPLHPRTRKILENENINTSHLLLIEPVGYLNMVWLIQNCELVMTDSGGLQKEAYFFDKPCITLRDETEWVELVEAGVNFLTGANKSNIISCFKKYSFPQSFSDNPNLYGNGNSCKLIVNSLLDYRE